MGKRLKDFVQGISGAFLIALAIETFYLPYWKRWGSSEAELSRKLPGDDIVPNPKVGFNQAITIEAPGKEVWHWVAQIGQDRGGFYSYDFLENITGCNIHSVDIIVPEYFHDEESEGLKTHPMAPPMPLVELDPERTLLFGGEMDPDTPNSWLFFLEDAGEHSTRLISRWRLDYGPGPIRWFGYRVILQPIACTMQRKMLLGIKKRAESSK